MTLHLKSMCLLMFLMQKMHGFQEISKNRNSKQFDYDFLNNSDDLEPFKADYFYKSIADKKKSTRDPSHLTCLCGMEYHLYDLGPGYFPRYIPTGICQKDTCGPARHCVEKKYKIRVLREKNAHTDILNEILAPKSIKDSWTIEFFTATVSCECHSFQN